MTGLEIFDYYLDKFNEKGTKDGEYAQLLMTIMSSIGEDTFNILEDAHKQGKRLEVVQNLENDVCIDNIMLKDIRFV